MMTTTTTLMKARKGRSNEHMIDRQHGHGVFPMGPFF